MSRSIANEGGALSADAAKARPDFAQLFEAMPGQYMILDRDLIYVEANPAYCASTERTRDEIVGRYVFDAFPPTGEGGRQIEDSLRRVLVTGVAETLPLAAYPIPMADGGFRMKYWSCAHLPLFDANGEVAFVAQNAVDVTELQNLKTIACGPDPGAPATGESDLFVRAQEITAINEALAAETRGLRDLFMQAPGFMAVLMGPELIYAQANNAYLQLIGHRPVVGRTLESALPEVVAQGFGDLLRRVMRERKPHIGKATSVMLQRTPGASLEERFVDFIFQPISGPDGASVGVFIEGSDVTDRVMAETRRDAMIRLADAIRDLETEDDVAFAAASILGEILGVSRVGYGFIDPVRETLTVHRDWTAPGIESLAGTLNLRDYGSFIDDLQRGAFVSIPDVERDDRTRDVADALKSRSAWSFVNFPMLRKGQLVGVLFVNHAQPRNWSCDDLALFRDLGERTRTATERAAAVSELRESEARLRALNEHLEAEVQSRTRELMASEEALRQSQKMDAVGQLTGGIAHDFNNLLAGISGSLELLQKRLDEGRLSGLDRYISAAQSSAHRAAALTQRLLAFARRQTLDPRSIDANKMIAGMADLLTRSVGPDVKIEVVQAAGLWQTKADPSQLENALLN